LIRGSDTLDHGVGIALLEVAPLVEAEGDGAQFSADITHACQAIRVKGWTTASLGAHQVVGLP
jgi:hypothetical protein